MRNLLGRLNARSSDDLVRIARFWLVPLPGTDRGRHVGAMYRVMTDIRACRDAWQRFDPIARAMIRLLTASATDPLTIAEIATRLDLSETVVRDSAISLFRIGVLAVQGDNQELAIGELPRLFLPRELGQDYRRILDELDAGDQSGASLHTLLEGRDIPDLEDTAVIWGLKIIPGLRRRQELVDDILQQLGSKQRIDEVVGSLGRPARAVFDVVRGADAGDAVGYDEAIARAGLTVPDAPDGRAVAAGSIVRNALTELETAALVLHSYTADQQRILFVPQEILHPGTVVTTTPLRMLQPLAADEISEPELMHPFALAWDVLTVVRDIISRGAPVWVPGEPLSMTWLRQLNRRLWFSREDVPPDGYVGLLLYLALGVGVLEPGPHVAGAGGDRHAVRPVPSGSVRQWRSKDFASQTASLRDIWLVADQWIEGRERGQIDVWGADWQGFRRRLLGALRELEAGTWYLVTDIARRFAEQDPGLVGSTFTAASARGSRGAGSARTAVIAQIVEIELETAMWWFGFIEQAHIPKKGLAMRVTDAARMAAADTRAVPAERIRDEAVLSVDDHGLVTLHRPAPVHIWSLTAFGDAGELRPKATYQLRPGSIGRALGAGFDLDQIIRYLEQQSGHPLPDGLQHLLREWTAGYKRVRMRRAAVLTPDFETGIEDLKTIVSEAGLEIVSGVDVPGQIMVLLPSTGEDAASAEETLQAILRANGFAGQWTLDKRT